jgi:PTS system mannose-specific IID component
MTVKKLSPKTLKSVFNRHYQLLGNFNYERQMATGYAWTMMPACKELYGDDPDELKKAVKRHLEFFNCATTPSPFIIGITCAMEEQYKNSPDFDPSSITAVKTALMGPLAGIGDSFFWGTFRVLGVGIGAPYSVTGSILGPILYFLMNVIPSEFVRRYGFKIGYEGGSNFLTKISNDGTLQKLTEAAKIMGLMVIGAMISSLVTFNLAMVIDVNGAQVVLQSIFDAICPNILPLLLVFGCYFLLKKKYSGTWIMVGLLVMGIILTAVGLL